MVLPATGASASASDSRSTRNHYPQKGRKITLGVDVALAVMLDLPPWAQHVRLDGGHVLALTPEGTCPSSPNPENQKNDSSRETMPTNTLHPPSRCLPRLRRSNTSRNQRAIEEHWRKSSPSRLLSSLRAEERRPRALIDLPLQDNSARVSVVQTKCIHHRSWSCSFASSSECNFLAP